MNPSFSIGDQVWIVKLHVVGIIFGKTTHCVKGGILEESYEVGYDDPDPHYVGHLFSAPTISHTFTKQELTQTHYPAHNILTASGVDRAYWNPFPNKVVISCECGKEKHGFANHSTWCPKAMV